MNDFLESIIKRDPAARSKLSLILTYPGVKAVFFHRIANFFSIAKFDLIARIISQLSRFLTGIEIHPKAKIGKNCIIGAKALITENKEIPDNSLVIGSPGKVVREVTEEEKKAVFENTKHYQDNWKKYSKSIF